MSPNAGGEPRPNPAVILILLEGRGIPRLGARGHKVGLGGFRRFPNLPDMATVHAGRAHIERPLGRHQCGLRNTLRHCLLVNYLVWLRSPGQDVMEDLSGTAVRLITSIDVRVWNGHKISVLLAGNPPAYAGRKTSQRVSGGCGTHVYFQCKLYATG